MITKEMTIAEVLAMGAKYDVVFERNLLTCAGCPGADMETLEQAAAGHGLDLETLLKELNEIE